MEWTEITISVSGKDTEAAAAIANMTVPYGIYIEDYSDLEQGTWEIAHVDLIDENLIKKDRTKSVIHIYISESDNAMEALSYLTERLTLAQIEFTTGSAGINDADWNENWKKYFKATEIGKKLVICPSWEKYGNKEGRTVIHLDPGAAFGTGTHASTSLCLGLLENYVSGNSKMLDIGCGSGILAIASVLLGAEKAVGVDIDAQSVKTAVQNADINNISDKTEFIVGNLAEKVSGKFDIVCANIVADVIIMLLENVADYMAENAVLIVSGIIDMREDDVKSAFKRFNFTIKEEKQKDNWRAFSLVRGE